MRISPIIAALGLMPLAGCSLFHSNVEGGFVCSAPRGTCAPSTTIDDSAIHAIEAGDKTKDGLPAASGDADGPQPEATSTPKEKKAWTFVSPARPVLRIVYLPWRDGSGHLHPRTTGFIPVDAPQLVEASSAPQGVKAMGSGQDLSLLTLAEMAPDMGLMAPASAAASAKPPEAAKAAPAVPADPTAAIKAQVKEILNQPQSKPVAPQPTQATIGAATFPPQGN